MPGVLSRNGRDLVAQAFAAASWHQHQRVAARCHVVHDRRLGPTKLVVTENLAKNLLVGQRGKRRSVTSAIAALLSRYFFGHLRASLAGRPPWRRAQLNRWSCLPRAGSRVCSCG